MRQTALRMRRRSSFFLKNKYILSMKPSSIPKLFWSLTFLILIWWIIGFTTHQLSFFHYNYSLLTQTSSSKTTPPPQIYLSGKFLFSPGSRDRYHTFVFDSHKIRGEFYSISYQKATEQLINKYINWADIKLILEYQKYQQAPGKELYHLKPLFDAGLAKFDTGLDINYLHSKFLVLDKPKFVIQTANLTYSAFFKNREYFLLGEDKQIREGLNYIFNQDRLGRPLEEDKIPPQLLVCPLDCRTKLNNLINLAQKEIIIVWQYIDDPQLINLLSQKSKHLDQFKILLPAKNKDKLPEYYSLQPYTKYLDSPYIHAKAMLIDQRYLLLGSINWSTNSLDYNREVGIVVTDKIIIQSFLKIFNRDRHQAH